jgi:hypothetical protein
VWMEAPRAYTNSRALHIPLAKLAESLVADAGMTALAELLRIGPQGKRPG